MSKVKQSGKLKTKVKPTPENTKPIRKQLPFYLNDTAPLFAEDKCAQEGYFNDKQALCDEDTHKCQQLFTNYIQSEKETQQRIEELREFTCDSGVTLDSSMPFYTCKSIIFNEYLICLKMYELFRLNSADFTQGPGLRLYQRLVYLKTLILKLSPVENKLEYQKNKLLKKGDKINIKQFNKRAADQKEQQQINGNSEEQQNESNEVEDGQNREPLQEENEENNLVYKPMVKNLIMSQTEKEKAQQGKYVAPRQSAVLPAEQKAKRRQQRQKERRKAHLLSKFRGDIESGDEAEEKHLVEGIDERFKKRYEEKLRFEEENFTRLNETKKQKYWKKQMMKNRFNNSLNNELKEIELIRELVEDETDRNKRPAPIPTKIKTADPKPHKRRKME